MKLREKSLKLIESAKIIKKENEVKECTFSPRFISQERINFNLISRDRAVSINIF